MAWWTRSYFKIGLKQIDKIIPNIRIYSPLVKDSQKFKVAKILLKSAIDIDLGMTVYT